MSTVMTERDLLERLMEANKRFEAADKEYDAARVQKEEAEAALIEHLENEGKQSTARYDGIGFASMVKPRLYANYRKENEAVVFSILRERGREDLIKPGVHPSSLSSFVNELIQGGGDIPMINGEPVISYYFKPGIRPYVR